MILNIFTVSAKLLVGHQLGMAGKQEKKSLIQVDILIAPDVNINLLKWEWITILRPQLQ